MANMAFEMFPDVAIVVHGAEPPTDAEWDAYLDAYLRDSMGPRPVFVVTSGGGPNSRQRARMNERLPKARQARAAVLTESHVARGIITALQWVGALNLKGFAPEDAVSALRYLELPVARLQTIEAEVKRLQAQLDVRSSHAAG